MYPKSLLFKIGGAIFRLFPSTRRGDPGRIGALDTITGLGLGPSGLCTTLDNVLWVHIKYKSEAVEIIWSSKIRIRILEHALIQTSSIRSYRKQATHEYQHFAEMVFLELGIVQCNT